METGRLLEITERLLRDYWFNRVRLRRGRQ